MTAARSPEFPAGRDGKQSAFKLAVALENIRLYRLALAAIADAPLIESRIWRGCELVLTDGVDLVQDGQVVATVASNNEYGDYIVRYDGRQWLCECVGLCIWLRALRRNRSTLQAYTGGRVRGRTSDSSLLSL